MKTILKVGGPVFFLLGLSVAHADARPADIVDLKEVDPTIQVDMMYFSPMNFMGRIVVGYKANICFVTKTASEELKRAQARLQIQAKRTGQDLSLLVRDCYRPKKSVSSFVEWAARPDENEMKAIFYPDLTKAQLIDQNYISPVSGHSRASSVDLTIGRKNATGVYEPIAMGTRVDFFGVQSHTAYPGATPEEKRNRKLLMDVMGPAFRNYSKEWWHYALKVEPYPTTFFDFDVEAGSVRAPGSITSSEMGTYAADPQVLAVLDRNAGAPLSLAAVFRRIHEENRLPLPAVASDDRSRGSLLVAFRETYGAFAEFVKTDIDRIVTELGVDWEKDITKTYDPASAKTPEGKVLRRNGNVLRVFNEKWLASSIGQFLLAGVVNRIDRRGFTPGSCGEVRLIYRLGYETEMGGETYASRTPFTLSLVFQYRDDGQGCRDVASLWKLPIGAGESPAAAAKRLLDGPVNFSRLTFKQMEMNAQIARFPSDLENDEKRGFAGQSVYLMRIFGVRGGKFVPLKLENTPDVTALLRDADKAKRLRAYLATHTKEIDTGVYQIPDEFLADVALSYSTLGSRRRANRPFDLLFTAKDADETFGAPSRSDPARFAATGRGFLERLNLSTCMGCHQSSSTAGFHFLGFDRTDFGRRPEVTKGALDGNRLVLPFSPHVYADLPRRAGYLATLVGGQTPDEFRPHPSAPAANVDADENMPCPLAGETAFAGPAAWKCDGARGLSCSPLVANAGASAGLGECTPPANRIYAGLSCRKDEIQDATTGNLSAFRELLAYNIRSFRDRVSKDEQLYGLPEGKVDANHLNCRPTRIGVPLGRVTRSCSPGESALRGLKFAPIPSELCAVVGGKGFEEMAKGYFSSRKFAAGVGRGLLNACSPTRACREDYICQEMPDFLTGSRFGVSPDTIRDLREKKIGFCTPTYFVYQLRLDGHPNPN